MWLPHRDIFLPSIQWQLGSLPAPPELWLGKGGMGKFVDIKKYKQMKMIWYNSYCRILFPYKSATWTVVIITEQLANVALANDNPYNVFIRGKKGGLGKSEIIFFHYAVFFHYKCRKVQTDDCLDKTDDWNVQDKQPCCCQEGTQRIVSLCNIVNWTVWDQLFHIKDHCCNFQPGNVQRSALKSNSS